MLKLKLNILLLIVLFLSQACSQSFTVSVNNQAVYDPLGRLPGNQTLDANLQGCINLALQQQNLEDPTQLSVLSCSNGEIRTLENIGQLRALRFLDLANNNLRNLTPLENLRALSGLNLSNNSIVDIGPLLNIASLSSVNLVGNNEIPCSQLDNLRQSLRANLLAPESCRD